MEILLTTTKWASAKAWPFLPNWPYPDRVGRPRGSKHTTRVFSACVHRHYHAPHGRVRTAPQIGSADPASTDVVIITGRAMSERVTALAKGRTTTRQAREHRRTRILVDRVQSICP